MSEDDLIRKPVGKHTQAEADRESTHEDGHKHGSNVGPMLLFCSAAMGGLLLMSKRMRGGGHEL